MSVGGTGAAEPDREELAARTEQHEAEVWARCADLAARLPGDPLGAVVARRGSLPLAALTKVPSDTVNRVVALGVVEPATSEVIEGVVDWYRSVGQPCFRVELAPVAGPPGIEERLRNAGLDPVAESVTKVWRPLDEEDPEPDVGRDEAREAGIEVVELTSRHAEDVAALNVRAWGAWRTPVSMAPWFSVTVGCEGFRHYGIVVDDRLVSTGALVLDGELAWIGFDATHPRHQSRLLRRSLTLRRMEDARDSGCRLVHAEARTEALTSRARLLRTLYLRRIYVHRARVAGAPTAPRRHHRSAGPTAATLPAPNQARSAAGKSTNDAAS